MDKPAVLSRAEASLQVVARRAPIQAHGALLSSAGEEGQLDAVHRAGDGGGQEQEEKPEGRPELAAGRCHVTRRPCPASAEGRK